MRSSLFIAAAVALSLAPAQAITIAPLQFTELVARADLIVYGRVADVHGQWTDDRQGIESLVTLDVIDRFKGPAGPTLRFKVPGGRAGNMVNVLPGAPTLSEGDLVVIFLASRGPAIPRPVGLSQGVVRVMVDPRSGDLTAGPPLGFAGESGIVERGSASRAPIRLSSLADSVRARAEAGR
jgi:hypothetical protein